MTGFGAGFTPNMLPGFFFAVEGLREYPFVRVLTAHRTFAEIQIAQLDALNDLYRIAVEINGLLLRGGLDPVAD